MRLTSEFYVRLVNNFLISIFLLKYLVHFTPSTVVQLVIIYDRLFIYCNIQLLNPLTTIVQKAFFRFATLTVHICMVFNAFALTYLS